MRYFFFRTVTLLNDLAFRVMNLIMFVFLDKKVLLAGFLL